MLNGIIPITLDHCLIKICQGENIDFPYRDIFLYYRYYHNPENLPKFTEKAVYYQQQSTLTKKILKKLGLN